MLIRCVLLEFGFDDDSVSMADSRAGRQVSSNTRTGSKVLIIRRQIRNEVGRVVQETEIVRDPRVIALYLSQNKALKKKKSDLLKKRKLAESMEASSKKVKCGNCGQPGHMKTNRACPLFGKFEEGASGSVLEGESGFSESGAKISFPKQVLQEASQRAKKKAQDESAKRQRRIAREAAVVELSKELNRIWTELVKTPNASLCSHQQMMAFLFDRTELCFLTCFL